MVNADGWVIIYAGNYNISDERLCNMHNFQMLLKLINQQPHQTFEYCFSD